MRSELIRLRNGEQGVSSDYWAMTSCKWLGQVKCEHVHPLSSGKAHNAQTYSLRIVGSWNQFIVHGVKCVKKSPGLMDMLSPKRQLLSILFKCLFIF